MIRDLYVALGLIVGCVFVVIALTKMSPLQGLLIDQGTLFGMPAVNVSFILPLLCSFVVTIYGYRTLKHRVV